MRKFSRQFLLVDGKKYYLVSVKDEYSSRYEPVAFFQKSQEKDEFGFMITGDTLQCPHIGKINRMHWIPLPTIWLMVPSVCQKCWGAHRTPENEFNCILRSQQVKAIDKHGAIYR